MDERELTQAQQNALAELRTGFNQAIARAPEPGREDPSPRRRFAGFTAAAAGLAVVGLIVWAVASPSDSRVTVDDAIASIADVAASTEAPSPGAYVYSRTRIHATQRAIGDMYEGRGIEAGDQFSVVQERETWLSMKRPGLTRVIVDSPVGPREPKVGFEKQPALGQYHFADRRYSYAQVQKFAKDPAPLIDEIERAAATSRPVQDRTQTLWRYLSEPLIAFSPPLPSSIRAALIRGLEEVDGVSVDTTANDSKDRGGEQLAVVTNGLRLALLFDPENATLLESTTTVERKGAGPYPDSPPGTVLHQITLITQRTVPELPSTD